MALIKPSPLVAQIRGSVGGVTFTRARAGAIARINSRPHNTPDSRPPFDYITSEASRAYRRAAFTIAARRWIHGSTQAQRDSWDALAKTTRLLNKLGEPHQPTGRALFIRSFCLRTLKSAAGPPGPPTRATTQTPVVALTWDAVNSRFDMSLDADFLVFPTSLAIWVSPPRPPTVNVHSHPFYLHSTPHINAFPLTLTNSAHAPGWQVCMAYWFRVRVIDYNWAVSHPVVVRALSE